MSPLVPMDWRAFLGTFVLVFLTELGDKTQLAPLLMASRSPSKGWVLAGAATALCAAALGVAAGSVLGRMVPPPSLQMLAGLFFVAV